MASSRNTAENQTDSFEYKKEITVFSQLDSSVAMGKKIFLMQCANCHYIFKNATGPALNGVDKRWPDKKELFAFMRNPSVVIARNSYAKALKDKYGSIQPAFFLTDKEMQGVMDYIKREEQKTGIPVPQKKSE